MTALAPDLELARRFLALLDPDADAFTFQTATDAEPKPQPDHLARVINLPVDNLKALATRNGNGAAVWVMVNEGDFKGRKEENVRRVRSVYADLDGAPLDPVLQCELDPHVVVESSPGRFHVYWLVTDLPLDQFAPVQKAIAARFNGDRSIHDLCRVMRLPGLAHAKDPAAPFVTRIVQVNERMPYSADEVLAAFPPVEPPATGTSGNGHDAEPLAELVRGILTGESYHAPLCALAWRHLSDGMDPGKVVLTLRGYMDSSTGPRDDRWRARYAEIPRTVGTGQEKLARQNGSPHPAAEMLGKVKGEQQAGAGDWPEPDLSALSEHRLPAPAMPLEVFGDYWAGWIAEMGEAKSCAPDYAAAGLLASAGALIGNARWGSPWDSWSEPPIVWIACVGNPSSGKSPGLDAAQEIVCMIEGEANENYAALVDNWKTEVTVAKLTRELWEADCKAAIKKGALTPTKPDGAETPERPAPYRIVTNDPTIEKVARLVLANPKGLLLHRDELAGWIGSLDKYGGNGSDRAFYLEAFGGRRYAVDRVKDAEPIVVPALAVSIAGGIQPDRLNTLVLAGDDDGLAARFLYLWPERVPPRRPRRWPPSGAKAKLGLLHALEEQRGEDGRRMALPFSEAAAGAIQTYREQVAQTEVSASGLFLSWLGKLPGMAARLAVVLEHLVWCGDHEGSMPPTMVSERSAVAAIAFLDGYAMPMARRCFGEAALPQVDRDAIALARWLAAQEPLPNVVNARALRRACAVATREPERYDAALAELGEAGWTRPSPSRAAGAGRQRKDWSINPRLKELLA